MALRLLDDEAALGPDRHDQRVLHHLGLDEPEYLGAVVLGPIAPAQPASCDRSPSQVHALHTLGAHEDLVDRARLGEIGDPGRIELERSRRCVEVGAGSERRLDQRPEHPHDAVVVERWHLVEPPQQLVVCRRERSQSFAVVETRIEPGLEQFDEHRREVWQPGQRVLDVRLAERESGLVCELRVAAQHVHLPGGESGEQYQPVEPVGFDLAEEQPFERSSDLTVAVLVDHDAGRDAQPDVVHVAVLVTDGEVVRVLVERLDAEVAEQGQQIAQRHLVATAVHPHPPHARPPRRRSW